MLVPFLGSLELLAGGKSWAHQPDTSLPASPPPQGCLDCSQESPWVPDPWSQPPWPQWTTSESPQGGQEMFSHAHLWLSTTRAADSVRTRKVWAETLTQRPGTDSISLSYLFAPSHDGGLSSLRVSCAFEVTWVLLIFWSSLAFKNCIFKALFFPEYFLVQSSMYQLAGKMTTQLQMHPDDGQSNGEVCSPSHLKSLRELESKSLAQINFCSHHFLCLIFSSQEVYDYCHYDYCHYYFILQLTTVIALKTQLLASLWVSWPDLWRWWE